MLSADRYIAVCHPISAPKYRTPVIARCVSLTAWAASALLMVPVFMYAATLTRPDGGQTCNIFWPDGKENSDSDIDVDDQDYLFSNATDTDYETEGSRNFSPRAFTIYSLVLGFAIPLSLILIFYAQVVFKLRTVGELSFCVKGIDFTQTESKYLLCVAFILASFKIAVIKNMIVIFALFSTNT